MIKKEREAFEIGYAKGRATERLMKENADGCLGCAFEHVEEWELPCAKCKRNCKDYWRMRVEKL